MEEQTKTKPEDIGQYLDLDVNKKEIKTAVKVLEAVRDSTDINIGKSVAERIKEKEAELGKLTEKQKGKIRKRYGSDMNFPKSFNKRAVKFMSTSANNVLRILKNL